MKAFIIFVFLCISVAYGCTGNNGASPTQLAQIGYQFPTNMMYQYQGGYGQYPQYQPYQFNQYQYGGYPYGGYPYGGFPGSQQGYPGAAQFRQFNNNYQAAGYSGPVYGLDAMPFRGFK